MPRTRREIVFFILGGFFLTNAIVAELTGGKLFAADLGFIRTELPIGLLPWPVVFICTDLVNEYFGRSGVRMLTFLTVGMIGYVFVVLLLAMQVSASAHSSISDAAFTEVFGQSMWIIVGSLTAFLISQFVDVLVFHAVRKRTGHRMLWLRATGSTFISQFVDTFVVQFIGFVVPGKWTFAAFVPIALTSYAFKLVIAATVTPLIYVGHAMVDRYLKGDDAPSDTTTRSD